MDSLTPLQKLEWPDTKYMHPAMREFKAKFDVAMEEHSSRARIVNAAEQRTAPGDVRKAEWERQTRNLFRIVTEMRYLLKAQHLTIEEHQKRVEACLQRMRECVTSTKPAAQ